MKSFPAGLTVKLTLPFTDQNGDPVSPAGLSFTVTDLDGVPVVARTVLPFEAIDTDTEITIPSLANVLAPGEISGGRVVRLAIETADGIHQARETYVLRAYERLVPPRNSFMTDAAAQALAFDIPGLTGFAGAGRHGSRSGVDRGSRPDRSRPSHSRHYPLLPPGQGLRSSFVARRDGG